VEMIGPGRPPPGSAHVVMALGGLGDASPWTAAAVRGLGDASLRTAADLRGLGDAPPWTAAAVRGLGGAPPWTAEALRGLGGASLSKAECLRARCSGSRRAGKRGPTLVHGGSGKEIQGLLAFRSVTSSAEPAHASWVAFHDGLLAACSTGHAAVASAAFHRSFRG
jgi:hypothetical protein